MKRFVPILLLCAAFGCASPYRADVESHGDVHFSTDAAYFLVGATGSVTVRAVDKSSGAVLWEYALPAGTAKAWHRSGKTFTAITEAEAKAALGIK